MQAFQENLRCSGHHKRASMSRTRRLMVVERRAPGFPAAPTARARGARAKAPASCSTASWLARERLKPSMNAPTASRSRARTSTAGQGSSSASGRAERRCCASRISSATGTSSRRPQAAAARPSTRRRGGARARRALARLTTGAHARVSYPSPVNLAQPRRLRAAHKAHKPIGALLLLAHALGGVARLRRARARRHPVHLRGWHVLDALCRMRAQRLCRPRVRSACRAHARARSPRAR